MRSKVHQSIYAFSLLVLAVGIPTSNAVMNLAGACLFANWVLEWNWKEKWNLLKNNRLAIVLAAFFFLFVFTLFQTDHWQLAFQSLASKTPFFYLPIIMASSKPLNIKWQRFIILGFVISVVVSSFLSLFIMYLKDIQDIREGGLFISHIRFSICCALSVIFALYFSLQKNGYSPAIRVGCFAAAIWLVIYLFVIQVFTGIFVLFILTLAVVFYFLFSHKKSKTIRLLLAASCIFLIGLLSDLAVITYQYYHYDATGEANLPLVTSQGNEYEHDRESMIENGEKIGLYVCRRELAEEWQKRSDSSYYRMEKTLIRYLNSKGLCKDADGVKALTDKDITHIEQGIANVDYTQIIGLKRVLYPTFFSLSLYKQEGITTHSSFLQRVELWQASCRVFSRNYLVGCGLGGTKSELGRELQRTDSDLPGEMGCHNQFLTYGLTGGVFFVLAFIIVLIAPFFDKKRTITLLYVLFFIALIGSMFTEDTLETVAGLNLFLFFNSYFLFVVNHDSF